MRTLILYVDAWPYRFIDVLLRELRASNISLNYSRLIPVYGYTDCFKVSLLTGLYPNEHGYWVSYGFTEKNMPKPIPKAFSMLLDRDVLAVRGLRFVLSRVTGAHMFHVRTWGHIVPSGIDPEVSFTEMDSYLRRRGFTTLFSFLESRGLRYSVVEDRFYGHRLDYVTRLIGKRVLEDDVVFAYIDEPDFWGHRYGVGREHYLELLRWLAKIVKYMVSIVARREGNFIVFSDHGMANVEEALDLYHYLLRDPYYGRTYVAGIDATFFRIFYLSHDRRDSEVLKRIKRLLSTKSHLLRADDLKRYGLPNNRFYGDEVYGLREGVVLYPNFFSWLKPRGMHAYVPDNEMQHGIVVASEDVDLGKEVDVKKLHTIIKDLVG